jgi:hypothetical protein
MLNESRSKRIYVSRQGARLSVAKIHTQETAAYLSDFSWSFSNYLSHNAFGAWRSGSESARSEPELS